MGASILGGLPGLKPGFTQSTDNFNAPIPEKKDWLIDGSKFVTTIQKINNQLDLSNGLVKRSFSLKPDCATIALDNLMTGQTELRAVRPEAVVVLNGEEYAVGGLKGQSVQNYLSAGFVKEMAVDPGAFHFTHYEVTETKERFPWKRNEAWSSQKYPWPVPGKRITFHYIPPKSVPPAIQNLLVQVVYEMYDGIPVISKWITIKNSGNTAIRLNRFKAEILSVVETAPKIAEGNPREYRIYGRSTPPSQGVQLDAPRDYIDRFTQLFVVTDYAMGGDMEAMKDNPGVHWLHDPAYEKTGIRYYGEYQPALLECKPPDKLGPEVDINSGETWESFRVFEMLRDSAEQERRGLAERRFWRMMAPWSQENPIFMHVREADPASVKQAIDQCAAVGFEMVIMTFGSGFNIENKSHEYILKMKDLTNYARSKNIAIGGYSLLASRGGSDDVVIISGETGKPATNHFDGARFGRTPCLATDWGLNYFDTIKKYFDETGMNVFEHDGSYPGDPCASEKHSGHQNFHDSQWRQFERIRDFYRWCRAKGIYLNVPDWYFMNGSSKTAMGYVETNWSLPREYQLIIERQNIYDGTWQKTPSMGWMFVPLTQYHGGGEAATIEPLHEHIDHYSHRMADLFGAGVQAIYRGPRLFDTTATKSVVKRWVDFYKRYRTILDSDVIHLRRPDGRDWDGLLHVNPGAKEKGFAMIFNPLDNDIERKIKLPLYYTGLNEIVRIQQEDAEEKSYKLERDFSAIVTVKIPGKGYTWLVLK